MQRVGDVWEDCAAHIRLTVFLKAPLTQRAACTRTGHRNFTFGTVLHFRSPSPAPNGTLDVISTGMPIPVRKRKKFF